VIDCPFPARFDPEKREWDLAAGPVSWDEVLERWKGRGEMNRVYVQTMQRGYQSMRVAA
jgi:ring-1,2-phenylacetyl-CoA epoxidase subunit PaaA